MYIIRANNLKTINRCQRLIEKNYNKINDIRKLLINQLKQTSAEVVITPTTVRTEFVSHQERLSYCTSYVCNGENFETRRKYVSSNQHIRPVKDRAEALEVMRKMMEPVKFYVLDGDSVKSPNMMIHANLREGMMLFEKASQAHHYKKNRDYTNEDSIVYKVKSFDSIEKIEVRKANQSLLDGVDYFALLRSNGLKIKSHYNDLFTVRMFEKTEFVAQPIEDIEIEIVHKIDFRRGYCKIGSLHYYCSVQAQLNLIYIGQMVSSSFIQQLLKLEEENKQDIEQQACEDSPF